jgi:hypothetical protein
MTDQTFEAVLEELYKGEVIGEAFFNRLIERFPDPEDQFKSSCMLQLETEFKARLRPFLLAHRISLIEQEEWRQVGLNLADTLNGESWQEVRTQFVGMMDGFIAGFKEMQSVVLPVYQDLGEFMITHEQSIHDFATLEAAGNTETSIDNVVEILVNPLPSPNHSGSAKLARIN